MNEQQLVERIGFAERWLDRAKGQCRDGDVPRGLLTLFLANAEMTYALRTAGGVVPGRRGTRAATALAVASALALACVVLASSAGAPSHIATDGPAIVTLGGGNGSLLEFVQAAPQHQGITSTAAPAPRRIQPAMLRRQRPVARTRPAPVAIANTVPKAAVVRPDAPQMPTPVATSSSPADAAESGPDLELISLVLTAERTLRTQARP